MRRGGSRPPYRARLPGPDDASVPGEIGRRPDLPIVGRPRAGPVAVPALFQYFLITALSTAITLRLCSGYIGL